MPHWSVVAFAVEGLEGELEFGFACFVGEIAAPFGMRLCGEASAIPSSSSKLPLEGGGGARRGRSLVHNLLAEPVVADTIGCGTLATMPGYTSGGVECSCCCWCVAAIDLGGKALAAGFRCGTRRGDACCLLRKGLVGLIA